MSSDNSIYDELVPLFEDKDDHRVRLFLYIWFRPFFNFKPNPVINDIDQNEWEAFVFQFSDRLKNQPVNKSIYERVKNKVFPGTTIPLRNKLNTLMSNDHGSWKTKDEIWNELNKVKPLNDPSTGPKNGTYGKVFSYKIDDEFARIMLAEAKEEPVIVSVSGSKFIDSLEMPSSNQKYYRKSSDPSKLYTKDASGNEMEVQRGSDYFNKKAGQDACVGTQTVVINDLFGISSETQSCTTYLRDCLAGKNTEKCKDYMANKAFWSDHKGVKDEIEAIVPAVAVRTLDAFGFKHLSVLDSTAGMPLNKVESVDTWLARLKTEMKDNATYKNIEGNTNLTLYLSLLVNKVNGSPAILNDNYVGTSDEARPYNPDKFKGQLLHQYRLKPKLPTHNNFSDKTRRLADTLRYGITGLTNVISPKIFVPVAVRGTMMGGAIDDDFKYTSVELENQYNMLKKVLESNGKKIDANDDKILNDLISSLKSNEYKVVQSVKIINKYVELMETFKYNDPHKVLNVETLNKIVDVNSKLLDKVARKQESVVKAVLTLSTVAEENKVTTPTVEGTVVSPYGFSHNN